MKQSAIITSEVPPDEPYPILFDRLGGQLIRSTALRTDGAAGPSSLDASARKCMCTSFKYASTELCDALASTARRICTSYVYVEPCELSAFVACCLIALDKCPGIQPIGIGEVAWHIIARATANTITEDIQAAADPIQVCAGQLSGYEAPVHAMHRVFESPEIEAMVLVDAANAFNLLN